MGRFEDWIRQGGTRRLVIIRLLPLLTLLIAVLIFVIVRSMTTAPEPQSIVVPEFQVRAIEDPRQPEPIILDSLPFKMPPPVAVTARQTVAISVVLGGQVEPLGSGFLIGPDRALTAAHVLPAQRSFSTVDISCGGLKREGLVIAEDRIRDVAVIETDCPATRIDIDDTPLTVEDQLYLAKHTFVGLPFLPLYAQRELAATSPIPTAVLQVPLDDFGRIPSNLEDIDDMVEGLKSLGAERHMAIAGALVEGNSGSPVFRPNGSVVGLVAISQKYMGRSFMVPASSILHVLRTIPPRPDRSKP